MHDVNRSHSPSRSSRRLPWRAAAGIAFAASLALSACSGVADAPAADSDDVFTLTAITQSVEGSPPAAIQDWFYSEIEQRSEGRIVFDRLAPNSLCPAVEIVECIRDGRADVGSSTPDYTPQYFPDAAVIGIPFTGQNAEAIMTALYQVHEEFPEAQRLYESIGLKPVATWPVGKMLIGTKIPVTETGDLSGLRIRVTGEGPQAAFGSVGANPVALPASEAYEAANTGVIDGVGFAMDGPVNFGLMEVLGYWTDPGIGHYSSNAIWFNAASFDRLPSDLQQIIEDVRVELNEGAGIAAAAAIQAEQCDAMLDSPDVAAFNAWSPENTETWRDLLGDDSKDRWIETAQAAGLTEAEAYLDRYLTLLEEAESTSAADPVADCVDRFSAR